MAWRQLCCLLVIQQNSLDFFVCFSFFFFFDLCVCVHLCMSMDEHVPQSTCRGEAPTGGSRAWQEVILLALCFHF